MTEHITDHIVYLDDIEDIVIAKYFIETKLLKKNEISEKMSLNNFIGKFINMSRTIAMYNVNSSPEMIPFFVYVLDDDRYIFFATKSKGADVTVEKLKKLNYDISQLNEYSGTDNMLRVENYSFDF